MKILVTGGAGYIGSALSKDLLYDNTVDIYDNFLYNNQSCLLPHISEFYHNIRVFNKLIPIEDILAENRYDAIVHLAAIVGQKACDDNPQLAVETNVGLTEKICLSKSLDTFLIFPNTNSGYGNVPEGVCDEDTPQNPVSLYGRTKCQAESIVRQTENAVVFRLATVFGLSPRMRMDLLLTQLVYRAMFDRHIELFEPHYNRNFVHINDIISVFAKAMRTPEKYNGQVFNLGNDQCNISKEGLVKLIQKYVPCTYNVVDKKDPDQRNYIVSNAKINQKHKHWVGLDYGIQQTIAWLSTMPQDKRLREAILSPYVN